MANAATIKAGQAVVTIKIDTKGLEKQAKEAGRRAGEALGKQISVGVQTAVSGVRNFSSIMTRRIRAVNVSLAKTSFLLLGVGVAMRALGRDVVGTFGPAIRQAISFEETMNRFNIVFGSSAGAVDDWSQRTAAAINRSELEMKEFLAQFQTFFVGFGFDRGFAAGLSQSISTLISDISSFQELTDKDVGQRIFAGLSGSTEALDKLGISARRAQVEMELLRQGIKFNEATEQEKVLARLNLVIRATTDAAGDAFNTYSSFANMLKGLQAEFQRLQIAVGQTLTTALRPFLEIGREIIKFITEWVTAQSNLGQIITASIAAYASLTAVFLAAGTAVGVLAIAFTGLAAAAIAVNAAVQLLLAPFTSVAGAILAITSASVLLSGSLVDWSDIFKGIVSITDEFKISLDGLKDSVTVAFDLTRVGEFGKAFKIGMLEVEKAWVQAWDNMVAVARAAWANIGPFINHAIIDLGHKIDQFFRSIAELDFEKALEIGAGGAFGGETFKLAGDIQKAKDELARLQLLEVVQEGSDESIKAVEDQRLEVERLEKAWQKASYEAYRYRTPDEFRSDSTKDEVARLEKELADARGEGRGAIADAQNQRNRERRRNRPDRVRPFDFRRPVEPGDVFGQIQRDFGDIFRGALDTAGFRGPGTNQTKQFLDSTLQSAGSALGLLGNLNRDSAFGGGVLVGEEKQLITTIAGNFAAALAPGGSFAQAFTKGITNVSIVAGKEAAKKGRQFEEQNRLEARINNLSAVGSQGGFSARAAILSAGPARDPTQQREEMIRELKKIRAEQEKANQGVV